MPTIEIISVRFNLGKNNDRKLFEELQQLVPAGKKNEFFKQLLYDHLMKSRMTEGRTKPTPKKQTKEDFGAPVKLRAAETLELEHHLYSASGGELEPVAATNEGVRASGEQDTPAEALSEAAGLATSFVQ